MKQIQRVILKTLTQRLASSELPFLQVILGPRQTGKSTLIQQAAERWNGSKEIASADQVTPPHAEWIEFLWQKALEKSGVTLLAIDEIQKVRHWSESIKRLFDRDRHSQKLRVVLSGSASLGLQQGLTETLAGRYEIIRCPHWGLDECQEAFGWDLITYLKFGGYPAPAFMIDDVMRWQAFLSDSIVEPVLGRDLQSMVTIQKPGLLRQLFALAMQLPAQEISYQKLLGQLQDEGNTATIKHYLDILKGGFLLDTLEKYFPSPLRQKSSSPKIIPAAPALIHAFSNPAGIDSDPDWRGRVFEAAIGAHLRRCNCELFYWREGDLEVDFVAKCGGDIIGVEVKSGRRKRTGGLIAFKKKFPKAHTLFVDWEAGKRFLATPPSLSFLLNESQQ